MTNYDNTLELVMVLRVQLEVLPSMFTNVG